MATSKKSAAGAPEEPLETVVVDGVAVTVDMARMVSLETMRILRDAARAEGDEAVYSEIDFVEHVLGREQLDAVQAQLSADGPVSYRAFMDWWGRVVDELNAKN